MLDQGDQRIVIGCKDATENSRCYFERKVDDQAGVASQLSMQRLAHQRRCFGQLIACCLGFDLAFLASFVTRFGTRASEVRTQRL